MAQGGTGAIVNWADNVRFHKKNRGVENNAPILLLLDLPFIRDVSALDDRRR